MGHILLHLGDFLLISLCDEHLRDGNSYLIQPSMVAQSSACVLLLALWLTSIALTSTCISIPMTLYVIQLIVFGRRKSKR